MFASHIIRSKNLKIKYKIISYLYIFQLVFDNIFININIDYINKDFLTNSAPNQTHRDRII